MTVLVLGDQLCRDRGPLAEHPEADVLFVEARDFAARHPYHPHKLTLVHSAMRHCRDELRDAGRTVHYHESDTFADGLAAHAAAHPDDDLTAMRPASHGAGARLQALAEDAGLALTLVEDARFICDVATFDEWAEDRDGYLHEDFYRFQRRETGYLVADGEPVGGRWNYDEDNRETPPPDWEAPPVPSFEPDAVTSRVQHAVTAECRGWADGGPAGVGEHWADPGPFRWPVTRQEAQRALDHFVEHRLRAFGPYQDAMRDDEWALAHSLLSAPLNIGLLHPRECIEAAIDAWERDDAPLQSVEGFVRQLLGWREFCRHVYRREMPALVRANRFDATAPLPPAYWTGETDMACLEAAVDGVRRRGYAHHIERLMVCSNLALLLGVDPRDLNHWFHVGFVDGFHWVTTPNVVEMGLAAADVFTTKPYAASANYVDRMSDHCAGCRYDPDATVGDDACPLNALYWDFLDRHEETLRPNGRMALVYSHLDDKDASERAAIRERAERLRGRAIGGDI